MAAFFRRPIRRTRGGRYVLTLGADERTVLSRLAPQLRAALADPDTPGLQRLFPPAYSETVDADKEDEYSRLMRQDLVERHAHALEVLEQTVTAEELTVDQLDDWARALNHLRLAIGTRLDVSEDDEPGGSDPDHQLYYFLGYLQECVIEALAGES